MVGSIFRWMGDPNAKKKNKQTNKLFFQSKSKLRQLEFIAHPSECQGIDQDQVKMSNY